MSTPNLNTDEPKPLAKKTNGTVRALVDYGGLGLFVIAYFLHLKFVHGGPIGLTLIADMHGKADLVAATWWLVAGSALSLILGFVVEKRLAPMPLVAGSFALVFGCLTLAFHDPRFLKIKPTVTNLTFSVALFLGLVFRRNPLAWMTGDALPLPEDAWRKLTFRYAIFFLGMAVLNEIVWRTQPDGVWVLFRFPGLWLMAVVFSLTQLPFLMTYLKEPEAPAPPTES
jgi:intracellular septation protein